MRQIICNQCGKKTKKSSRAGVVLTTGVKIGGKPIIIQVEADVDRKKQTGRYRRRRRGSRPDTMDLCVDCLLELISNAKLKVHKDNRDLYIFAE